MYLGKIICYHINRLNCIRANINTKNDGINVRFILTVPKDTDDDYLVSKGFDVIYPRNTKLGINQILYPVKELTNSREVIVTGPENYLVKAYNNHKNSRQKFARFHKEYKLVDLIAVDIKDLLIKEHEKVFRELRSNIVLEKIGKLSKRYEKILDGKFMEVKMEEKANKTESSKKLKVLSGKEDEVPF